MNTRSPATAGRLSRLGGAAALVAGTFLALGSGAAHAVETTFTGFTDGCFGLACVPPANSAAATTNLDGLTYRDSTFSVTTAGGFVAIGNLPAIPNVDNLGSFTLSGSPFVFTGNSFDLLVTFTAPPGTTPSSVLITSTLTGTVNSTDNGGVFVNFDNTPRNFTFGSGAQTGTFTFSVNDLSLVAGGTVAVSGVITSQVSAIPEPETYALLMAGLAAVGFMSRRRKKA
jgi:hypothetical protein